MIEINLLPEGLGKKKRKRRGIPRIKFTPFVVTIFILILSTHLILVVTLRIKRFNLGRLEAKWALIESKENALSDLKKQVNFLENKIRNIESIKKSRILWSRKLNDLSDSMIPGIWLTHLSLEAGPGKKYLSIKGCVSSFRKEEAAIIGRFMKILKENKTFFRDFDEIELSTMQQEIRQDIEAMSFSINCYFKN